MTTPAPAAARSLASTTSQGLRLTDSEIAQKSGPSGAPQRAAAGAGFVIALYTPVSRARPWQLGRAFELLREALPSTTAVVFGRAAGRVDERIAVVALAEAAPEMADMATCVIVGSPATRTVARGSLPPLVYTPRFGEIAR